MANFLIKREDGHFLQVRPDVLASLPAADLVREDGWGLLRLRHVATGDFVVIDDEMPGLRIWFEGGRLDRAAEAAIVAALSERLAGATGHALLTIPLG